MDMLIQHMIEHKGYQQCLSTLGYWQAFTIQWNSHNNE